MWTARLLILASLFAPAALGESQAYLCVSVSLLGGHADVCTPGPFVWYQNIILSFMCQFNSDESLQLYVCLELFSLINSFFTL